MSATRNESPMFEKVAFTMLPVKDMKRARAFYEKTLGLSVGSHSSNGIWTEYDLPGGGCVALFATQSSEPGGGGSLAFEVADLDRLLVQLDAKGVYFEARMVHSPVCRMSMLKDSEGNSLVLHELSSKRRIATPRSKAKPKTQPAETHAPVAASRTKMPTLGEQPRARRGKKKPPAPARLKTVVIKKTRAPKKTVKPKPARTKAKVTKKKKR
jgi:predicted enzyme related to lactoylglutathione lyase